MTTKQLKDRLMKAPIKNCKHKGLYLSLGSTRFNLACSGRASGALRTGKIYLIAGGSNSGKTWVVHAALAEATINPDFDDFDLYYDAAEDDPNIKVQKFFGKRLKQRLKAPRYDGKIPVYSETLEDFYYGISDIIDKGRPFIYVLDSMDGLVTEDEEARYSTSRKRAAKGKEAAGSYGTSKAKKNSEYIRIIRRGLKRVGGILVIISQARANFGFGAAYQPDTRSGGRALTFYCRLEIWMKKKMTIKIKHGGPKGQKKRQQGIVTSINITKNHLTGKEQSLELSIYHSFGIDEVGSCVDFLIEENHWKKSGGRIKAKEFGKVMFREDLIQWIDQNNKRARLQRLVAKVWETIEDAVAIKRKNPYK